MSRLRAPSPFPPEPVRELMLTALPSELSLDGKPPSFRYVYLPASHVKALHPAASVVAGMRGAGKSFWWAALQEPQIRALVAQLDPRAEVLEESLIAVGFGERPNIERYPSRDVLEKLLRLEGVTSRLIWRTVVAHNLPPAQNPVAHLSNWEERVHWVRDNPEAVDRLLEAADTELARTNKWFLILFDALDRSASTWRDIRLLTRGLLETTLDFRVYRRLRVKCFMRIDQLEDKHVVDFPDASKVTGSPVELTWPVADLYGLFWQYLANSSDPWVDEFREIAQAQFGVEWLTTELSADQVWRMSPDSVHNQERQRHLVHAIAGPWMGGDRRRGFPYTWIPGHLADAHGRVSPRSFLAALREAAEDTNSRYPGHSYALHYESIKRGVQRASDIRVRELEKDYAWVDRLMQPLRGLTVPCRFEEIRSRWVEADVFRRVTEKLEPRGEFVPPPDLPDAEPDELRLRLEQLGIFLRMGDGRVNIPDVFRVGYGLGRKGGVRPLQKASVHP